MRNYPATWYERVPAEVFACLLPGEIQLLLCPGVGLANGGARYHVPFEIVPPELRMPNTLLWVKLDDNMNVVKVWKRELEE
ncbi:hypothetical protein UNDKW_1514 [Undibacterium sp. KW1]|nr:hypothetical protein UNDKW_1514 [Undibacterium sp. KW1]